MESALFNGTLYTEHNGNTLMTIAEVLVKSREFLCSPQLHYADITHTVCPNVIKVDGTMATNSSIPAITGDNATGILPTCSVCCKKKYKYNTVKSISKDHPGCLKGNLRSVLYYSPLNILTGASWMVSPHNVFLIGFTIQQS